MSQIEKDILTANVRAQLMTAQSELNCLTVGREWIKTTQAKATDLKNSVSSQTVVDRHAYLLSRLCEKRQKESLQNFNKLITELSKVVKDLELKLQALEAVGVVYEFRR